MFDVRDRERYGKYHVYIPDVGNCILEIDISGFGELFTLCKGNMLLFRYDTSEYDFENMIEEEDGFHIDIVFPVYREVLLKWDDMKKVS